MTRRPSEYWNKHNHWSILNHSSISNSPSSSSSSSSLPNTSLIWSFSSALTNGVFPSESTFCEDVLPLLSKFIMLKVLRERGSKSDELNGDPAIRLFEDTPCRRIPFPVRKGFFPQVGNDALIAGPVNVFRLKDIFSTFVLPSYSHWKSSGTPDKVIFGGNFGAAIGLWRGALGRRFEK